MARDIGVTFAGGGGRAFHQVGFMERWWEQLLPRLGAVAGCSAGSAMAVLIAAGRTEEAKAHFAEQRQGVDGHVDWSRLRRLQRPFPHDGIYRKTLAFALEDGGFERIKALPFPLRILCASFPKGMPTPLGIALGLAVYQSEKKLRPLMVHPRFPRRFGFQSRWWDARECESPEQLVELVLSSSSTPPFTKRGRHGGQLLIDGSLIDNAPAFLAEEGTGIRRNLVMMTRPYPEQCMGRQGQRLYVSPEEPLPIERWDYTERAPVEETMDVGRRDAVRFEAEMAAFLR